MQRGSNAHAWQALFASPQQNYKHHRRPGPPPRPNTAYAWASWQALSRARRARRARRAGSPAPGQGSSRGRLRTGSPTSEAGHAPRLATALHMCSGMHVLTVC